MLLYNAPVTVKNTFSINISFWGPVDKYNWLESSTDTTTRVSPNADPGIFDDDLRPKPAYFELLKVL